MPSFAQRAPIRYMSSIFAFSGFTPVDENDWDTEYHAAKAASYAEDALLTTVLKLCR